MAMSIGFNEYDVDEILNTALDLRANAIAEEQDVKSILNI